MKEVSCKLLVIGAGPGGYVCAIRAGQLGIDTVIVEAIKPGGTCLNVGCIPSKALIHAADEYGKLAAAASGANPFGLSAQKPALDLGQMRRLEGRHRRPAHQRRVGPAEEGEGQVDRRLGPVPRRQDGGGRDRDGRPGGARRSRGDRHRVGAGRARSVPFGKSVISSTEALALTELPKRLVVVGAGYIGLELGTAFAKLGSDVTVVEALPRILAQYDTDLTRPVAARLEALGVKLLTGAKARRLSSDGKALSVEAADGKEQRIAADKILVTVGRRPAMDGWGLEELELDRDDGALRIDDQCRTSMRGVHAIGDVTGEPMLAHRAMAQGQMVAEIVAGQRRSWDQRCIPAVCFTDPEIVTAGLGPEEARARGREIRIGQFPFTANGRAMTLAAEDGFVRIVARADNNVVLGIQAVGTGVSELSAAFALAIEMGARLEDIAGTIHVHPTESEAFPEAALKALGRALHA
jgi:dihydrolipoamide dehydrogenase